MDDFSQPGLVNYYGYAPSPANFIKPCKLNTFTYKQRKTVRYFS